MRNNSAKAAQPFDTALILPALVVCVLYAAFLMLRGLPGAADLAAKERALADAQAAAVSPQEVRRLQQEQTELKQKSEDTTQKLEASRRQAAGLARRQALPLGRIEVVAQIEDLLKRHGLEVTRVRAASDQADSKLAASLQKATAALSAALVKAKVSSDKSAPPNPLPFGAQLEEQMEAARMGLAAGNSPGGPNAQPLDLREMEIRGDYHDMLEALQALADNAGDSAVVSVGFERPGSPSGRVPLLWRLVVHVQPETHETDTPSRPTVPAEVPRLASQGIGGQAAGIGEQGSGIGENKGPASDSAPTDSDQPQPNPQRPARTLLALPDP